MFHPEWAPRDAFGFPLTPLAPRPTRLCQSGLLLVNFHSHRILDIPCDRKSPQRGLLILLAPPRRSVCFLEPCACVYPFRYGFRTLGFDRNQISRIDILNLHLRCAHTTPLVCYQIFWYDTKGVRYHTKRVWFCWFCDFA